MKKIIFATVLSAGVFGAASTTLADDQDRSPNVLNIAVYGDSPYGTSNADKAQFNATPAFIKTINNDPDVSLVVHVGDIHSGKESCSLAYDQAIHDFWKSFKSPLVYTPGDNEWTDCNKSGEGGSDPLVNLAYVRDTFFATPGNAIAVDKPLLSQSQNFDPRYPTDAAYVENVMWQQSGIVFVTMNLPGGSNNDEDNWFGLTRTQAQTDEILNRTGADLRWLDKAFALAKSSHARAVVIVAQADMWDLDSKAPSHIMAYRQFVDSIALHATDFARPVLLLNGDSHNYRSDNPLAKGAPCVKEVAGNQSAQAPCTDDAYDNQPNGYNVTNFHRIVVHGSTPQMEWLKLTVKPGESEGRDGPDAFGPFSWKRMIQALP